MTPGSRIGPYEILAKLGEGGMGEVYRARDTKLNRDVAIKVLPDAFAKDAERLARIQREAQVLAALNHPNIAQIYGMEGAALIMELVDGENLKGPMPLEEALPVARQLAEALEAAHEKGIVHRDLKPANIKITRDGKVKVLDFGLAKALQDSPSSEDLSNSPTLSIAATKAGLILGTAAYMSPEQARGKGTDRRADIFSYGVVLLEMLTGQRAFQGEMLSDVLASVMRDQPAIPPDLPPNIARLLRRCLEKDPRKRLQAIGEARLMLEELAPEAAAPAAAQVQSKPSLLPWMIAGAMTVLAAGAILWPKRASTPAALVRLNADLGPSALSGTGYFSAFAVISPDGSRLLYAVRGKDGSPVFASRLLSERNETLIAGTEGGTDPFFSPDGQSIGFFAEGKLKKISVNGGAPVTVAEAINARGATWGEDGTIVVALTNTTGLSRIPASGGAPQPLTQLRSGEATHRWPQFLPGGEAVVFTANDNLSNYENGLLDVVNLKTGERTTLQQGGYFGRYAPSGHLVYVHEGALFALAVGEPSRLKPQGGPAPVLDDVASLSNSGSGQFDFSRTGVFVYRSGKAAQETWLLSTWNEAGKVGNHPQLSKSLAYMTPRFSPDGRRLALCFEVKGIDIYTYDIPNDVLTRLTFSGQITYQPVWTPDGRHIAYRSTFQNTTSIMWIRNDGAGGGQKLLERKNPVQPSSFSPDGKRLAFEEKDGVNFRLRTVSLDLADPDHPKPGKTEPFGGISGNEKSPAFSPDGRWIAYASDESGPYEVYVRPFPDKGGGKWQVSFGGGQFPVWSHKGPNLFFESLDGRVMVASYTASGDSFAAGKPKAWSDRQLIQPTSDSNFDVSPQGDRVAGLLRPPEAQSKNSVHVTFLLNFFDELRRKANPQK